MLAAWVAGKDSPVTRSATVPEPADILHDPRHRSVRPPNRRRGVAWLRRGVLDRGDDPL